MQQYEIHPVANLMPGLTDEEFEALKKGIAKDGQLVPIQILENQIIDGRHRYWACRQLGIEPTVSQWNGPTDPEGIMSCAISINVKRRHLSTSQRSALAVSSLPIFEQQAKLRQELGEKIPEGAESGRARERVATIFAVNDRYVAYAKSIKEWNEVIFNQIITGEVTLQEAGKLMKKEMAESDIEQSGEVPDVKVPKIPFKFEADVSYDIHAAGCHLATMIFKSDEQVWEKILYEA